ncbi:hypothetical protein H6H03_25825 [Nostoc paludosum FACHB-159]|uniref:Uncharacterized protein n=1 Tax=Nostoc paludosum FACHB-159 TaxID=2692908 RepID=A0ABR8KEK7_9NOSO|nr:hypothetical protein [Nostoc sp. FACHB-857]MBD2737264.1 hypothetical protein [Nostoc paludosum FACHB-159]
MFSALSVVACGKPLTLLLVRPLRERRYRFANASTIFRYLCVSPGEAAPNLLISYFLAYLAVRSLLLGL